MEEGGGGGDACAFARTAAAVANFGERSRGSRGTIREGRKREKDGEGQGFKGHGPARSMAALITRNHGEKITHGTAGSFQTLKMMTSWMTSSIFLFLFLLFLLNHLFNNFCLKSPNHMKKNSKFNIFKMLSNHIIFVMFSSF